MKRKFISQPILASWKDAYRQMEEVFDPLWNDEVIYYETHKAPYAQGPAMQAVYDLYREHKGDPDWDEAYARFTASGASEHSEAIMSSSVVEQDAGMILEVFQDAVDEIEIPEGYNWDYKIDQLQNGELAGQIFIMTDDDQPVAFFTFALTKDGESLDIVNNRKLYTKLVNELKSEVRKLGDMSEFVGKPKQETITLTRKVESHMKRVFSAKLKNDVGMTRIVKASVSPSDIDFEHCFIIVDDDGAVRAFNGRDEASWVLKQAGYPASEIDSDESWAEYCEDHLDRFIPRSQVKVSDYTLGRTAYKLSDLLAKM